MRASKFISLTNGLFHLKTVKHGKSNVVDENGLASCIHTIDDEIHAVEHLHLVTPLSSDSCVLVKQIENVSRSEYGDIWVYFLDFLFSEPLSPESSAVRIRISPSSRYIYKSLNFLAIPHCLGNGHGHSDVAVFEIFVPLGEYMRTDARNYDVGISERVADFLLTGEVSQLHVSFVTQVSSGLQFFESVVPDRSSVPVRIDTLRTQT
jgi:hypothetical protein